MNNTGFASYIDDWKPYSISNDFEGVIPRL